MQATNEPNMFLRAVMLAAGVGAAVPGVAAVHDVPGSAT